MKKYAKKRYKRYVLIFLDTSHIPFGINLNFYQWLLKLLIFFALFKKNRNPPTFGIIDLFKIIFAASTCMFYFGKSFDI